MEEKTCIGELVRKINKFQSLSQFFLTHTHTHIQMLVHMCTHTFYQALSPGN